MTDADQQRDAYDRVMASVAGADVAVFEYPVCPKCKQKFFLQRASNGAYIHLRTPCPVTDQLEKLERWSE